MKTFNIINDNNNITPVPSYLNLKTPMIYISLTFGHNVSPLKADPGFISHILSRIDVQREIVTSAFSVESASRKRFPELHLIKKSHFRFWNLDLAQISHRNLQAAMKQERLGEPLAGASRVAHSFYGLEKIPRLIEN